MVTEALLTIAEAWKQPAATDRWMNRKNMRYRHRMEPYSAIKAMSNAICNSKGGPRDDHTKYLKSDRASQTLHAKTYMWNLKYDSDELAYETETDSQA